MRGEWHMGKVTGGSKENNLLFWAQKNGEVMPHWLTPSEMSDMSVVGVQSQLPACDLIPCTCTHLYNSHPPPQVGGKSNTKRWSIAHLSSLARIHTHCIPETCVQCTPQALTDPPALRDIQS